MAHRLAPADRVAAAFLLVLLALGSLLLWIAVPAGWLWITSKIAHSAASHIVIGIAGMPIPIIFFGSMLAWLNGLYLRVTGAVRYDDEGEPYPVRGPLEPLLVGSLALAVVVMGVWFFVFASNPSWGPAW